jgi:hypothetical protein
MDCFVIVAIFAVPDDGKSYQESFYECFDNGGSHLYANVAFESVAASTRF